MTRSNAPLRIVQGEPCFDPREPIDQQPAEFALQLLFVQEAALVADLAKVRAGIADQVRRYRDENRMLVTPGVDRLRARLGPRP
jgi:hypothetical protein